MLKIQIKILFALLPLIALVAPSYAGMTTYTETLDIYQVRTDFLTLDTGFSSWIHANPLEIPLGPFTAEQYEAAAIAGNVTASLSLQVEDLDKNDSVYVWVQDRWDTWQGLGYLETMTFSDDFGLTPGFEATAGHRTTTTFELDPLWLDGLPVAIKLSGWLLNPNQIEIETSTLSVSFFVADEFFGSPVPTPSALLLGSTGIILVGWLRRRHAV